MFVMGSVGKASVGSLFTEDEVQDVVDRQDNSNRILGISEN
jgi:hypothetical protein